MNKLDALNRASARDAVEMLTPVIERAPEVAALVVEHRPFADLGELRRAIRDALASLQASQRIQLFRAHPELAPDNPLAMTPESQSEQARLDLTSDGNAHRGRLDELNRRYREKFGFPFITALVRHSNMESVMAEFEARLAHDRSAEIETAIEQIAAVSASRLATWFDSPKVTEEQYSQS